MTSEKITINGRNHPAHDATSETTARHIRARRHYLTMRNRKKKPGFLFIFEGPDGVGKSTLSAMLVDHLQRLGRPCELLTFPGSEPGTLGKLVYDLHHEPSRFGVTGLTPASQQAMHISAHIDAIEQRIVPVLEAGIDIVLDRYWWSTWVYGVAAGVERRILEALIDVERAVWRDVKPNSVFLVERDLVIRPNESQGNWWKLHDEYESLAAREQAHQLVCVIENNKALADALESVLTVIQRFTAQAKPRPRHARSPKDVPVLFKDEESTSRQGQIPLIPTHLLPVRPTVVFDTYWRFAAERQRIFFKRIDALPPPWTEDPILAEFKFTNAYRASDRVSQYLIRNVIYRDDLPRTASEVFFRIMLFKIFNKIETWKMIESQLGPVTYEEYSFQAYDRLLTQAMSKGQSIYSRAYIMPSGGKRLGHDRKHRNHLSLIERMMADRLPERIAESHFMQDAFKLLRGYPTIGDFLAYQYVTDVNYSEITNFNELEFVVPGPGSLDGIRKCFADLGGLTESGVIRFVAERQEREFERLGLQFQSLWGRRLQLIDCQNLFCEVDKYARVRHPEVSGITGRTRIKQRYSKHAEPLAFWFPPKWGINDLVAKQCMGLISPCLNKAISQSE